MVGSGTAADPRRPLYAPAPNSSAGSGIIGVDVAVLRRGNGDSHLQQPAANDQPVGAWVHEYDV
jgi:hypothetical protein